MTRIVFDVKGMSCQHCVNAVKKAAGSLEGVGQVDVTLATGKVTVDYDPAKVAVDKIKAAIAEEGYSVA